MTMVASPGTKFCVRCGREINDRAIHCPYCNAWQSIPEVPLPTTPSASESHTARNIVVAVLIVFMLIFILVPFALGFYSGVSGGNSGNSNASYVISVSLPDGCWSGSMGIDVNDVTHAGCGAMTIPLSGQCQISVVAVVQNQGSSGTLTVNILQNGQVVKAGSTAAAYGVVSVNYTCQ
jgi:hypothetical protein